MPNLGFTICHLAYFSLGFLKPEGHLYLPPPPPGQCSSECWSKLEHRAGPILGNLDYIGTCTLSLSGVALRTRYVQLLSGCRRIGRSCWSCFIIAEMSCKPGFRD